MKQRCIRGHRDARAMRPRSLQPHRAIFADTDPLTATQAVGPSAPPPSPWLVSHRALSARDWWRSQRACAMALCATLPDFRERARLEMEVELGAATQ